MIEEKARIHRLMAPGPRRAMIMLSVPRKEF